MARIVGGMTMSLDGFVTDRNGGMGSLYADFDALKATPQFHQSEQTTGAVLMGRKSFDMSSDPDAYATDYEYQVPLFIVTSKPPAKHPAENDRLTITFVTDGMESAVRQALAAAGAKDVTVVGGAQTVRSLLALNLMDELHIYIMPVLLGQGLRLFDGFLSDEMRFDRVSVEAVTSKRTALKLRRVG